MKTLPQPIHPATLLEILGKPSPLMMKPSNGMNGMSAASWIMGRAAKITSEEGVANRRNK
jgi:hypothetical protein